MGFRAGGPFGSLGVVNAPDGVKNNVPHGSNGAHFQTSYNNTFSKAPRRDSQRPNSTSGFLRVAGVSTISPSASAVRLNLGVGVGNGTKVGLNLGSMREPGAFGANIKSMRQPAIPELSVQTLSKSRSGPSLLSQSKSKLRSQFDREARRKTLEMLADPDLVSIAQGIFAAHDPDNNGRLEFEDLCRVLSDLHAELDLPDPDIRCVEMIFKKFDVNNDKSLNAQEFFELFKQQLRRSAFDHSTIVSREFFITKQDRKVWSVYDKCKELGQGTFGTAYLAKHKGSGEERVVKAVLKSRTSMPLDDIEEEILIMRQVDHPHIVRLFEWYEDSSRFYLVLDALKGGTLKDVVLQLQKQLKGLKETWIRKVLSQSVEAMSYVHSLRLIHKDLKDENIMLLKKDANFDEPFAVIIDLGIAEMFSIADPNGREIGGTPTTMAPEVWSNNFGPKCDVFSLGCIFYEMMAGGYPFMATSLKPLAWTRLHKKGPDWSVVKTSTESKDLCKLMLSYTEAGRPTMVECRQHHYFNLDRSELKHVPAEQFRQLATYCHEQQVKRTLLLQIAASLPMDRASQVVELFEHLDKDRNGTLESRELQQYFKMMGITDQNLINETFTALDVNQDGLLSFSEFAAGALMLFKDMLEERLVNLFDKYDTDGTKILSAEQARNFLGEAFAAIGTETKGASSTITSIDEVMRSITVKTTPDVNQGTVSFEQLREYILGPSGSLASSSINSSRASSARSSRRGA